MILLFGALHDLLSRHWTPQHVRALSFIHFRRLFRLGFVRLHCTKTASIMCINLSFKSVVFGSSVYLRHVSLCIDWLLVPGIPPSPSKQRRRVYFPSPLLYLGRFSHRTKSPSKYTLLLDRSIYQVLSVTLSRWSRTFFFSDLTRQCIKNNGTHIFDSFIFKTFSV